MCAAPLQLRAAELQNVAALKHNARILKRSGSAGTDTQHWQCHPYPQQSPHAVDAHHSCHTPSTRIPHIRRVKHDEAHAVTALLCCGAALVCGVRRFTVRRD